MNREIAKEQYFYPEVKEIVSKSLESVEGRVILIVGQPGSGKSVFMSQLYEEFEKQDLEYLTAIRAEFLQDNDSPKNIYELFMKVKDEDKPKVLLLDSLDVLAYSRREELLQWLFYINKLKEIQRMTIICAARSFEAEHLYPMNKQDWSEKIPIRLLPDEFIDKVLKKVNYDYKSISQKFREFLRIPLHLKITVEIIEKGGDPKDIFNLHGLYAKLFELLNISREEESILMQLSELMIKDRTIYLPFSFIGVSLLDEIKKMKERPGITGIFQIDERNQRISFSHQTLIDYLSALKVIKENKSILDFIFEHGQSLFIRPVIRHILGLLRILSRRRLFEELEKIFLKEPYAKKIGYIIEDDKSVRLHIKTAILANMASWNDPADEEGKFLMRLFREAKDNKSLIIQFFSSKPTVGWYNVLKDKYIEPIIKNCEETDLEFRVIISYLANIAKEIPEEILEISLLLLKKQKNFQMFEWYLNSVYDELSKIELTNSLKEKYVYVLEKAIKSEIFSWYYNILIACKRIAKYNPLKALNLYLDCIKKELQSNLKYEGLIESFNEILPLIYEKIPYDTLFKLTDLFEEVFTDKYTGLNRLRDNPNDHLYSSYEYRFGIYALYDWYKNKILETCSNFNEFAKEIIKKLEQSRWETQRQLSMLCKLKNVYNYRNDVLDYIKKVLNSDLTDPNMYFQSELFIEAINEVLKVIKENEREEIINKILNFDFKDEYLVKLWIWKPLHHVPDKYKNEKIIKKLEEIKKKYNFEEYKYEPPYITSSIKTAQPIATADELQQKSPEELYEYLIKYRNLKPFFDPKNDIFYEGVEGLANEVSKVFIEDLSKYKNIIIKLANDPKNDIYLNRFFLKIYEKGLDKEHVDWLIDLISLVYQRENIQKEIIYALEKSVNLLTDEHFAKIKHILLEFFKSKNPQTDKFFEYEKQSYSEGIALLEGLNSVRGVLVRLIVSLMSKFSDGILIEILENLSNDNTISVKAVLIEYLPYTIKPLGWDKCYELFLNAFNEESMTYYDSSSIVKFLQYVPRNKFNQIEDVLNEMWKRRNESLGKSYAILMSIYYLRGLVSEEKLIEIFTDSELINEGKKEAFNLLVNQVTFEENVDKCLKVMDYLLEMNFSIDRIGILFMHARPEDLKKYRSIINKIIKTPELRKKALYYILEYLEKSLLFEPFEVFYLLKNILSNLEKDSYNFKSNILVGHSKAPLNIINTILECYPDKENEVLEVLDKLIKLNWNGVNEYLDAMDRF